MITLTFALPAESSGFVRSLQACGNRTRNTISVITGQIGNHRVEVVHTGVGEQSCRRCVAAYFQEADATLVISAGFAGAVRDELSVADILLAENYSDPAWLQQAKDKLAGQHPHVGNLFTSAKIVDSNAERDEMARRNGAVAVDMETSAIAEICAKRNIPLLSLRAISDTPGEPFPTPASVLFDLERQRTDPVKLSLYLLTHPAAVPRLFRFARQVNRARSALTQALLTLLRAPG
jgi:adenosylhomocysteine nucleosidase